MLKGMIFLTIIALMYGSFEPKIIIIEIYPIETFVQLCKHSFPSTLTASLFANYKKEETTQMSINGRMLK